MRTRALAPPRPGRVAGLLLAAVLAAACGSGAPQGQQTATDGASPGAGGDELAVAMASFDLAVGEDQRFTAGVLTPEGAVLAFGEVTMRFGFLGEDEAAGELDPSQMTETTATFLPVPGAAPEGDGQAPTPLTDQAGAGVYATSVDLDQAGFWGVHVEATLADGTTRTGTTTFPVGEQHQVPDVGDEAPAVDNLTADSDAEPVAIDSRAQGGGEIPDPQLHDTTVAAALEEGRPIVLVISTPVFCTSRFCGPITDAVASLADEYGDRAEFIHIEVWEDFEEQQLNEAAAAWIQTEQGGNEPWTFLIGSDGTVQARWDNVVDLEQLRDRLGELPAS